jgi:hypothetical protein
VNVCVRVRVGARACVRARASSQSAAYSLQRNECTAPTPGFGNGTSTLSGMISSVCCFSTRFFVVGMTMEPAAAAARVTSTSASISSSVLGTEVHFCKRYLSVELAGRSGEDAIYYARCADCRMGRTVWGGRLWPSAAEQMASNYIHTWPRPCKSEATGVAELGGQASAGGRRWQEARATATHSVAPVLSWSRPTWSSPTPCHVVRLTATPPD